MIMSRRKATILAVVALTLVAIPLRLVNLGALSFYADEETSAMPARSLAEGNGARMPTGMEYRRAIPLTWLNALSARIVGINEEVAYRLPTALFGILTVPILFLAGRSLAGGRAAFLAALLLALSEWHLAFSRQARMYVPFLMFFIPGASATWNWAETGRRRWLLLAVVMAAGALSMHLLGVGLALFALLALVLPGRQRVSPIRLVAFAVVLIAAGWAYNAYYVTAPFREWAPPLPTPELSANGESPLTEGTGVILRVSLGVLGGLIGALSALSLLRSSRTTSPWLGRVALFTLGTAAPALAWAGQVYAAGLAGMIFLILFPEERRTAGARMWLLVVLTVVPATIWLSTAALTLGFREGLKSVSAFPYPYPLHLAYQFPALIALFGGVCLALILRAATPPDRPLRATVLAVLLPIVAMGAVSRWAGTRLLFPAYPFLLLAASAALVSVVDWASRRFPRGQTNAALVLGTVVVLSGVIGGHGIRRALRLVHLEHGEPINEFVHMYPFRPDHASVGAYVREHRAEKDIVIAEDPLQQWWYAGDPIDFWLRSYRDCRQFLFMSPMGGKKDIYVGSRQLGIPQPLDSLLADCEGRVWLITSGETLPYRSLVLSPTQAQWLDSLETTQVPSFVGRDGVSRVFCLEFSPP
jgi:4-amino-4-deoxy-L-arabinose transferase-like glycosyltransferase